MKTLIAFVLFTLTTLSFENSFANRSCGLISCEDIESGGEGQVRSLPSLSDSRQDSPLKPEHSAEKIIQCSAKSDQIIGKPVYGRASSSYSNANASAINSCVAIFGYSKNCYSYACWYIQ